MNYFLFRVIVFASLLFINLLVALEISTAFISDWYSHTLSKYFWIILIYLSFYYFYRLMTRRMVATNELFLITKANILSFIFIFFIISVAKIGDEISRLIIICFFALNMLNPIWSYYSKKLAFSFALFRRAVFAVCDNLGHENISKWFEAGNPFGYEVKAVLNIELESMPQIHSQIDKLIKDDRFDMAVIDFDTNNIYEYSDLVDHIQKNIYRVIILPKISKIPVINGELISSISNKGMAFYMRNNLLNPIDIMSKKVFDFIASIFLVVLFASIFVVLYFVVFLSTKGHPLFTHKRIGKDGKSFMVYKFRTMFIDANERLELLLENCDECKKEWKNDFKLKNDPRITKIGKFLRKTSLDELPQFINVLKGEMSLVGPRPIVEDEIKKYGEYFEYFTSVKPGITGLWQVSGRNDIDYDERVQLDVWYVRNWSIELDIQILIKTILVVLRGKGSY